MKLIQIRNMVFKCQEDSFLKEYASQVVSCDECKYNKLIEGKEVEVKGYEVILEETILFPEGGGQPSDQGFLNDVQVYDVKRRGINAIHYVDKPLKIGETVKQTVDWQRRFDHMQQHSGQHLITAILDREYNFPTVSWWLGDQVCHVELDTPSISLDQINKAEDLINELIRSNVNVSVEVFKSANELKDVHTRGLPEDHQGDVRVITIEGIESNMCCGTHVTNLAQLQVVKLLGTEKSKRKNKILLYFLVGNRVIKRLATCLDREQQLTVLLKNNPVEHVQLVEKLQKNFKIVNKGISNILKDLAVREAQQFKAISPTPKYYSLHRKEATSEFVNTFIKEIGSVNSLIFLSVGDDKGAANITLYGNEVAISDLGNKISELLNGKGAGKGNRYQAKVLNIENRNKVDELIAKYFD